ncbi:hypothetical protein Ssi03_40330 [Sphaerisporangium siamense]|uniref:Uncharacterized protein n=1 Tax=Sphaerisporangium siamense TaxID=795645 RepID=A0A7W7GBB0_9ACTN|nr:hypothetical protein [Sphaerisporangium siamense]MBB4700811.1 hypothetical protein [Sphaerisporangium siamense]GII86043.1 hypothetical protein Ssi03_40330 [Sphaerisporangium siamense]
MRDRRGEVERRPAMAELAAIIADLLDQVGGEPSEQAARLGVDVATVYRWRKGARRPQRHPFETLLRVAEVPPRQRELYLRKWELAGQSARASASAERSSGEDGPATAMPVEAVSAGRSVVSASGERPQPVTVTLPVSPGAPEKPRPEPSPTSASESTPEPEAETGPVPASGATPAAVTEVRSVLVAESSAVPRVARRFRRVLPVAVAVVAVLSAGVVWLVVPDATDRAGLRDQVRERLGESTDIQLTSRYEDPGFELLLPSGARFTAGQEGVLRRWTQEDLGRDRIGLGPLIDELRAGGAANPLALHLVLTLKSRRDQVIHVDDVRPVDVRRAAPYAGTFLFVPPQGPGETVKMMFDFDDVDPRARLARPVDADTAYEPGGPFFAEKTLTIDRGAEEVLWIKSVTTRDAVTFRIRIDYRVGDGPVEHLVVDDRGHPFALSPVSCLDRTRGDAMGHARYDRVWAMKRFRSIEPVKDPRRFEVGPPYC